MVNTRTLTYSHTRLLPFAAAFLFLLALVACGGSPNGTGGVPGQIGVVTPTFIPTLGVNDFQNLAATTQALNAAAQGTLSASIAQETRIAEQATAQAQAIIGATASAEAYAATSTAQVIIATSEALEIQQTQMAMVATGTAQAIVNAQSAAAATQSANLYTQQLSAAATQQAIDNQIRQAQADREVNRARMSQWTPFFIILAAATLIGGAALFIWWRDHSAVRIVQNIAIMRQPDGTLQTMLVGNHAGTLALPAPKRIDEIVEGEISEDAPRTPDSMPPASWDKFLSWSDPRLIPVGCHALTRKPILVNRERKPHLMIAGDTGSGKTTLTESYVAGNLSAGLHVLIVNARGNDFGVFRDHPNVTVMPTVAREQRTTLLGNILSGMVKEMDRRDSVLSRYGARNWYELPGHSGQPGEFLVVVDEFLALVLDAQLRDKAAGEQMWLSLLNLTQEARKFGIYVTVTVTDPTTDALGKYGMVVRRQMGRIALSMGNAGASRQFIEVGKDEGWPRGSVGLPMGQFLGRVRGPLEHGVGFRPTADQMRQYLSRNTPAPNSLPDAILNLTGGGHEVIDGDWSDEAQGLNDLFIGDAAANDPNDPLRYLAHEMAVQILSYAPQATSLRDIERQVFNFNGGNATVVVKGVLIAKTMELYHRGVPPERIEQAIFGGPKKFAQENIIPDAITQYNQHPLAI